MTPKEFMQMQQWPYKMKLQHAWNRAQQFYDQLNGQVFCSVGGLDSITLLTFLRAYVNPEIPGVSISSLEDSSIQTIHKTFDNFEVLQPLKSKAQVIREHGFPVLSKDKAGKIQLIQNPTEKNRTVRHAIMTGETGKLGGYRTKATGSRMRLPQMAQPLWRSREHQLWHSLSDSPLQGLA